MITLLLLSSPIIIATISKLRWRTVPRCRSSLCQLDVVEEALVGADSVQYAIENVQLIKERLKTT